MIRGKLGCVILWLHTLLSPQSHTYIFDSVAEVFFPSTLKTPPFVLLLRLRETHVTHICVCVVLCAVCLTLESRNCFGMYFRREKERETDRGRSAIIKMKEAETSDSRRYCGNRIDHWCEQCILYCTVIGRLYLCLQDIWLPNIDEHMHTLHTCQRKFCIAFCYVSTSTLFHCLCTLLPHQKVVYNFLAW